MQSVSITTNIVNSNPFYCKVYSMQLYVINLSVTCGRSVVFVEYSSFLHQKNLLSLIVQFTKTLIPSPLKLWVWIPLRRGVLDITLCDKVCQWLAACQWFSPGILVSSTKKTYCHDIAEIILKVALNTITLTLTLTW
jgi:hypothetical protein